jgi:subtilisin
VLGFAARLARHGAGLLGGSWLLKRLLPFVVVLAAVIAQSGSASATPIPGHYIVVLKDGTNPKTAAAKYGVTPTLVYTAALKGYAANLTNSQLNKISSDPTTDYVNQDQSFALGEKPASSSPPQPAQFIGNSIKRIGGLQSPTAKIDGIDDRVDADIAVLDTGIDSTHPDLNVVGGTDCTSGQGFQDPDGHGTMVAGFAAAIDNSIGVVGVAPGARLFAVRVMDKKGTGNNSHIVCGIDWVTRHADTIEVANMSIGDEEKNLAKDSCQKNSPNAVHKAICNSVAAGVTYVVAAGNDSNDASGFLPAAYPEVITVSAMADNDGQPGGLGGSFACLGLQEQDDTFAFFSNFGSVIDFSGPGVCVGSTFPGGLYGGASGTSFAAPHVAGAAALYLANHPNATPAEVQSALIARREQTAFPDDPDGIAEGVVNVAGL